MMDAPQIAKVIGLSLWHVPGLGFGERGVGGIKNPLGVGEPLGLYPSALDWSKRKRKWWLY